MFADKSSDHRASTRGYWLCLHFLAARRFGAFRRVV